MCDYIIREDRRRGVIYCSCTRRRSRRTLAPNHGLQLWILLDFPVAAVDEKQIEVREDDFDVASPSAAAVEADILGSGERDGGVGTYLRDT